MNRTIWISTPMAGGGTSWTGWTALQAGGSTSGFPAEGEGNIQVRNTSGVEARYRVRGQNPDDVHEYDIDAGETESHTKHAFAQIECVEGAISVRFLEGA